MISIDKSQPTIIEVRDPIAGQDLQESISAADAIFQSYLHQFEKNPVQSIPLEVQKQLLKHYEELVEKQQISMHKTEEIEASGSGVLVPTYIQEKILNEYKNKIKFLTNSIKIETKIEEFEKRRVRRRKAISFMNDTSLEPPSRVIVPNNADIDPTQKICLGILVGLNVAWLAGACFIDRKLFIPIICEVGIVLAIAKQAFYDS